MMLKFAVEIDVMPYLEISDPQGQTIERSLPKLGFESIQNVRVGKHIEFVIDASDETAAHALVEKACAKFLTNPVIEQARIRITSVVAG